MFLKFIDAFIVNCLDVFFNIVPVIFVFNQFSSDISKVIA